jgi:hypothetical protein
MFTTICQSSIFTPLPEILYRAGMIERTTMFRIEMDRALGEWS